MQPAHPRTFGGLAAVLIWLVPIVAASAEEFAQKVEHLIKAAEHLEHAGAADQAAEIRQIIQNEHVDQLKTALSMKKAERDRLSAEIGRLERTLATLSKTADAPPKAKLDVSVSDPKAEQVLISSQIVKIDHAKMRSVGLDFNSLHGPLFDRSKTGAYVDDNGSIGRFIEILRRQDFATMIAAPKIATKVGQKATIESKDAASHGFRLFVEPSVSTPDTLRIRATLTMLAGRDAHTAAAQDRHDFSLELENGQSAVITPPAKLAAATGESILLLLKAERAGPKEPSKIDQQGELNSTE